MKKAGPSKKKAKSYGGATEQASKLKADDAEMAESSAVSPSPSSSSGIQEANTEKSKVLKPNLLVKEAKSKKIKSKMNVSDFEKSLEVSKQLADNYESGVGRPSLLRDIASFDKAKLKNAHVKLTSDKEDSGEESDETSRIKKKTTVSQKTLCYAFWNGQAYPVHKLKFIVLQIPARDEVTLDFSCLSHLTDLSFAILADMRDKESARFKAVERILLDGCFQITDIGLGWLAKAFPKLKWLSLVGCSKVTDLGLVTLAEECPDLISVDLSSTGVHFLPSKWHTAEGMRMSGCSVLFPPVPADAAIAKSKSKATSPEVLKDQKENLFKVCILAQNSGTKSLLAAVKKEKQTAKLVLPRIECGVSVDKGLAATFIETDESFSSSLFTNRSILVLTTELKDKAKIREEAEYMRGLVIEAVSKQPKTQVLIVGLSDDSAGIVPTDFIKDELMDAITKIRTTIIDTNYSLTSIKEMTVAEQLQYSAAQALQQNLQNLEIKSMEVNVDKEKDVAGFLEEIGKRAETMAILEKVTYSKQIYNWAKEFHSKVPADLSTGVYTLHEAAQILLKNTQYKERLRPFGAAHFLASIGTLSLWENRGQTYVASSTWLCKVLTVLLSPNPDGATNQGSFKVLDDSTAVWTIDALKKELGTKKLDWAQVEKVLNCYPYLWKSSQEKFTTYLSVPQEPSMDPKVFLFSKKAETSKGRLNVGFLFALSHNVTSSVFERIMTSVIQIGNPIHVWRHGVILHDSVLAVMVAKNAKIINVNAYIVEDLPSEDASAKDGHEKYVIQFLWNSFLKYRLAVVHELSRAGLVFEELHSMSDALQPVPAISGSQNSHSLKQGQIGVCEICGIGPARASLLADLNKRVEPRFLGPDDIVNGINIKGFIDGCQIKLTGPSEFKVRASLDPFGCHVCSILLIQGNVKLLIISFSSAKGDSLTLNLNTKTIEQTVAGKQEKVTLPGDLGTPTLQGERGTFRIESLEPFTIGLYLGPRLVHTAQLPFNRYNLHINSMNFTDDVNEAVFTVTDSDFCTAAPSFQVSMRLEAWDKLNPSLICVATIESVNLEKEELLVHFDGWTKKYDYWTNFTDPALHPIGYMAERGQELSRTARRNPNLQAPHGYKKTFDWLTYCKEIKQEPVPYEVFTNAQLDGTTNAETLRVQSGLGVSSLFSEKAGTKACYQDTMTSTHMELRVQQVITKVSDMLQSKGLNYDDQPFCFLPDQLNLQTLQFPCLAEVLSPSNQRLHCICSGQVCDFHFVNHRGLTLDQKQVGSLSSWVILAMIYAALICQKKILPSKLSEICGMAEEVPNEKHAQLETAIRRILHLYISHFLLMNAKGLDPDEASMKMVEGQTEAVKKVVEDALKSDDAIFKQQFGARHSSIMLCQAHRLANSPSAQIQEITIDSFQNLAGNIYALHLENNPLSSLPADLFEHFTSLTQLVLDGCQIAELPDFKSNTCLEEIHVKYNRLTSFPDDMKQLSSLKVLNISHNPLDVLPPMISSLKSLTELYADNIGTVDLASLCQLTSLVKLSVSQNLIPTIPDKLSDLPLTVLDMGALPRFPCGTNFSMHTVKAFVNKYTVYRRISDQDLQKMVETIENMGEQTTNSAKIMAFGAALFDKYPRIGKMGKETSGGENVPAVLFKLTQLVRLDLSSHSFRMLGDEVKSLVCLEHLNLSSNPSLQSVSPELANLPLKELNLRDCLNLKTPPKEVVRRGYLAVFGYLRRLLQGSVSCKRTKLMMVGLGGAGKTSLVRALTNKNHSFYHDYGENITDGIDITEWKLDSNYLGKMGVKTEKEDSDQPLHFSVWDFAGQTVYYNTHQFFLSNRAVYLLLWNIRLGFEHAGLDFWLSSVACHAPKAPILVVGTHCDKVEKGKLPMEELKRRFPQIVSFHFVSSYSGEGIHELRVQLVESALAQKYMGEKVPEAWLSLEKHLDKLRKEEALLPWKKIEDVAGSAGIFDNTELVQAVQFLHDLGSLQFFNTQFLRSHVVIVPQWIVDVMACIVTVHEGPIQNGKLLYSNMKKVWKDYPEDLHPWLLRLTEEFDLTFPLLSEDANIVPCLLPNTEPKYDFAPVNQEKRERESKMVYKFEYLPAGLFNRAQVRLHQFSDSSVMWKKGFMLKKNNHRALLLQISNTDVVVVARGYKPENTLFLVHEVFECLIADAYSGVSYDFSIPCAECVSELTLDPCMFPASKIKRAFDMKAPFLQCDKNFHIISIPEIQASLPPDSGSDFDDHLGRSVRELQDLGETGAGGVRCLLIYTKRNCPGLEREGKEVDPTQVLADLRAAGINVSYCDDPETANMETLTLAVKAAQAVVIGISDEFVESTACRNLLIYIKETLNKITILMAIGTSLNWQKTDINLVCASEVFVKMTQIDRYKHKLPELVQTIQSKVQKKKIEYPECFISYCWANSKTAADAGSATKPGALGWGDPRKIKDFLQSKGVNCWLDVEQMGQEGFFEDLADGLRKAKVMVAFVSDEYAMSKNCKMEFRFAVSTLKIPTVLAVVGTGYAWERTEVGLLTVGHSQNCPKVNLQYENEAGLLDLLKAVQDFLPKSSTENSADTNSPASQQAIAFQEVLELTQRKLLRHISMYSETMDFEPYPRLVLVDLIQDDKKDKKTDGRPSTASRMRQQMSNMVADAANKTTEGEMSEARETNEKYCLRLLCEYEQGWHESSLPVPMPPLEGAALDEFLKGIAPYQARVLAILKHSSMQLPILTTTAGDQLRRRMEEWCARTSSDFQNEYQQILQMALDQDEQRTFGGLKRCHMPNGKILWLCDEHEKCSLTHTEEKYKDQLKSGDNEDDPSGRASPAYSITSSYSLSRSNSVASLLIQPPSESPAQSETEQVKVKVAPPAAGANALPRRPKLTRRNTSGGGRKTTSQACLLM